MNDQATRDRFSSTRRSFLKYLGGAAAAGAIPEALVGCAQQQGEEVGAAGAMLEGPIAGTITSSYVVARASDGFDMQMDLMNLQVVGGNLTQISASAWSYVILRSHPQHTAEQTVIGITVSGLAETTDDYDVTSQAAGPSRIVFCVAPPFAGVPFKLDSILSWLGTLPINVAWNALSDPNYATSIYGVTPTAILQKAAAAANAVPDPTVTALELSTRLVLSPNEQSRFVHSNPPAQLPSSQRVELANTRLAVVDPTGAPNELLTANRTLRAIYTRDEINSTNPFLTSVPTYTNQLDLQGLPEAIRYDIVNQSGYGFGPAMPVDALMLTPYGATFQVNGNWEETGSATAGLISWKHRTSIGRDSFVQATLIGYLLPFGLRAICVMTVRRQIAAAVNEYAALYATWELHLLDTSKDFSPGAGLPLAGYRAMPFSHVEAHQTTFSIDAPATTTPDASGVSTGSLYFQPKFGGVPLTLPMTAIDRRGRQVKFNAPMYWSSQASVSAAVIAYNASAPPTVAGPSSVTTPNLVSLNRQRVGLAPSTKDHTTVELDWLWFQVAQFSGTTCSFIPVVQAMSGVAEATRGLVGNDAPMLMYYHSSYAPPLSGVTSGNYNAVTLAGSGETVTASGVALPSAAQTLLTFGSNVAATFTSAQGTGGLATPSATFGAIGMVTGLSSTPSDIANLATGAAPNFAALLGSSAMLFGEIPLTAFAAGLGKVPAFMSEAYSVAERYAAELDLLVDPQTGILQGALSSVNATVKSAAATAAAALANVQTVLQNLPAATPAQIAQVGADVGNIFSLAALNGPLDSALAAVGSPNSGLARAARNQLAKVASATNGLGSAVTAALQAVQAGLDVARDQKAKIEWHDHVTAGAVLPAGYPPLLTAGTTDGSNFSLSVEINGKASDPSQALTTFCSLDNFTLNFPPVAQPWLKLGFDRIFIHQQPGQKLEVDVNFDGVNFFQELQFIETIASLIPLAGFSDPPNIDVTANGIVAGFSTGLPNIAAGVLSFENMKMSAELTIPFVGSAITFEFAFCDSDHPFAVTVAFLGGGGYFNLAMAATSTGAALQNLEGSISVCAQAAINLVVASGSLSATAGITVGYQGGVVSITAFVDLRGALDILGLISMSIEAYLGLTYTTPNSLTGTCTVSVDVEVAFISKSVSMTFQHTFWGGPVANVPTGAGTDFRVESVAVAAPLLSPGFTSAFTTEAAYAQQYLDCFA